MVELRPAHPDRHPSSSTAQEIHHRRLGHDPLGLGVRGGLATLLLARELIPQVDAETPGPGDEGGSDRQTLRRVSGEAGFDMPMRIERGSKCGGILHGLGAATAIPFGPFTYTNAAGPRIFGVLAWPITALWIIAILNSRGVARLILRPWRKIRTYGFWLIGITAVLTVLFDVALEPFATRVKHF